VTIALVSITHTAAYSACAALRRRGYDVVPRGGEHYIDKLGAIRAADASAVVWLHWQWADHLPLERLAGREVVTVLRDPMECAISAAARGLETKCDRHAAQWLRLSQHIDRVDTWIAWDELDSGWRQVFARAERRRGVNVVEALADLPRLNERPRTTPDLLAEYRAGTASRLVKARLRRYLDCLRVVHREIDRSFAAAGAERLLKRWRHYLA